MFDKRRVVAQDASIRTWMEELAKVAAGPAEADGPACPAGPELIDQIRALEELKAAASAAQARAAALVESAVRRSQADAGVQKEQLGKGIGAQIGFARRESPHRGTQLLGLARILTKEMPKTLQALSGGFVSEWRATILVRETACLTLADRQRIDDMLAGNPAELEALGDRQLIARIKGLAYGMDPASVVNRAAKAASERFVSCRPAPDTMTYLTGLLPVAQGVEVFATLAREADRLRAAGDSRGRGQIMADTLVERITGRSKAGDVRVEVQLVMTDQTLLAGAAEPAVLPGYGVIPAQFARDLVRRKLEASGSNDGSRNSGSSGNTATEVWLRRLFTAPSTGQLVDMDSKARLVPAGLARFIAARDQNCRMPWCGAPIRHFDHIKPWHVGGTTTANNVQGLCEACNHAKEAPGWACSVSDGELGAAHTVETVTPPGHRYRSAAPAPPGVRVA
ncbi:HNH endonuclease signature motif containing protein [Arthrobacter sp. ZGTC212]|uniref:HNH endonuclease n=1 Tax=Arthrobacter sp. ZGTC212 TaxID=2058899 RepID=UPI000CE5384B|nr:HNH endonuclease signature motif containing protein [Arthrobacter sp. ZGTC212]